MKFKLGESNVSSVFYYKYLKKGCMINLNSDTKRLRNIITLSGEWISGTTSYGYIYRDNINAPLPELKDWFMAV